MSEEILINVSPQETRVAVVENGILQEVLIERKNKRGLVGNIIKARVSRVLPGMQSAFIDIGLERTGFLHISDILDQDEQLDSDNVIANLQNTSIRAVLQEGQDLMVQVIKDPIGTKGARLTTRISIPSRYLVYLPDHPMLAVSQRIEDVEERNRLQKIILDYHRRTEKQAVNSDAKSANDSANDFETIDFNGILNKGGFIIRTAAEGASDIELHKDIEYLYKLWDETSNAEIIARTPKLLYEDLALELRTMRDYVHQGVEKVRIDAKESYDNAVNFSEKFLPEFVTRIEHYTGARPLLELYSVEDEIQKSLNRKIQLKSGGHLVIDQTEAMTTIDVNTGAFVGHKTHEETIYKTNLEASQAICRQLRLRNLGGIIIIDFIDMVSPEHQRQVLRSLEKHLEKDTSKYIISELTSLGLVQLTRKRTRESLEHVLCETCPTCDGRGKLKTTETVCYEIFREIIRESMQFEAEKLLVVASQPVIDMLLDDESINLAELEENLGKPITFQVEPYYSQEQYDIVPL
ncbi:MAG: S1 RNA-binding domain-containing protein [Gammaproteobacteria bacterium]|nr:S1 RNA-binding domain-containing protein [Gammaproteobacteria bacterium]